MTRPIVNHSPKRDGTSITGRLGEGCSRIEVTDGYIIHTNPFLLVPPPTSFDLGSFISHLV
jgi:hypothetical protein